MSILATFEKCLKAVAKDVDVPAKSVSKSVFMSHAKNTLSEWDIRKNGGFAALKKLLFPLDPEVDGLETRSGSKLISQHRSKLEKYYGDHKFFLDELKAALPQAIKDANIKLHPPTSTKLAEKAAIDRVLMAHISDTHYGSNIRSEEMHGLNEFNWTVAARRTAYFMDQICRYKPQYRKNTELVLCLNGDIIAGLIHNQEWFVDLLTTQFAGTLSILGQAISYAAGQFKSVRVVCTPGNHGRNVGKSDKGRATNQKWDSYENMIYISLQLMMQSHKNVQFSIPEAPYLIFEVLGHKFFQTHGDTVVNVGNPGNALNMKSITNQINSINSSIAGSDVVAGLIVGHVHTPTVQLMQNGCALLINGCLSGTDPFAQSIGIFESNPTQNMWEVTKEHAVGDIRFVRLKTADTDKKLDSIISPFKGKF